MRLSIIALLIVVSVTMFAQNAEPDEGAKFAAQSKWPESEAAYRSAVSRNASDGQAWTGLGEAQLQQHKLADAQDSFDHAIALHYRGLVNRIDRARAFALAGNSAQVYVTFKDIIAAKYGGAARPIILSSPEFAGLTASLEFQELVNHQMKPCLAPEFRQFDFWLGDWKVSDPTGTYAGDNLVTSEQDGCLLVEHWKSSSGAETGTSFNYFDVRDKKWHQLYIDNSGNAGAFPAMAGELKDGKMTLLTAATDAPLSRWTWYSLDSNRVRQMAEQSTDGGKTWSITWDSVYVKKNAGPSTPAK